MTIRQSLWKAPVAQWNGGRWAYLISLSRIHNPHGVHRDPGAGKDRLPN